MYDAFVFEREDQPRFRSRPEKANGDRGDDRLAHAAPPLRGSPLPAQVPEEAQSERPVIGGLLRELN